jgi:hypothetical protein
MGIRTRWAADFVLSSKSLSAPDSEVHVLGHSDPMIPIISHYTLMYSFYLRYGANFQDEGGATISVSSYFEAILYRIYQLLGLRGRTAIILH